jgi:orotate phosphoribosyltransferase
MEGAIIMLNPIANALLRIKAVTLSPNDPYMWASGLRSPIYCDNRLTLSYPKVRSLIADALAEKVMDL